MHSPSTLGPTPSPEPDPITAGLRMILRNILAVLGAWKLEVPVAVVAFKRISDSFRRIERMLVRYRAGRLRVHPPRETPCGDASERKPRAKPALILPRRFGWLVAAGKHQAAGYGGQLNALLGQPEMAEMIATYPQARRVLRPVLRALSVELPWTVDQPRPPRPKRACKPKPTPFPEDSRIHWQRGEKTWTRKDRQMERLIKLKHELVLKMGKTNPW